jgi:hypothetical protein
MASETHLVWSPVFAGLCEHAKKRSVVLAIAPFVQRAAMEQLLVGLTWAENATVLTRWRAADVVSGVSDIEIYPLLKRKRIRMMVNDALHMKMFVFEDGGGFVTSANITGTGLGLKGSPNIEVGIEASLGSNDAAQLASLLAESRTVTDDMFRRVQLYVEEHRKPTEALPALDLGDVPTPGDVGLQLPLVAGPDILWQIYSSLKLDKGIGDADVLEQALHDIQALKLPGGLTKSAFDSHLREKLNANPIVRDILDGLEDEGSVCFGQVVSRMQHSADGNHAMGRRELKPYARALYDWLPWVRQGVYWDRPHHSMILRLRANEDRTKSEIP